MAKKLFRIARFVAFIVKNSSKAEEILSKLDNIQSSLDNSAIMSKQFLTKKEAAIYLGKTENFVSSLIKDREISYYQPLENGYASYIDRYDLDRFITRRRHPSRYEISRNEKRRTK